MRGLTAILGDVWMGLRYGPLISKYSVTSITMRPHTTNGNHSHAQPKIQSDTLAIYSNAKNSANIRTFHKHSLKNLKNRVGCLTEVIFNPEKSKVYKV